MIKKMYIGTYTNLFYINSNGIYMKLQNVSVKKDFQNV